MIDPFGCFGANILSHPIGPRVVSEAATRLKTRHRKDEEQVDVTGVFGL